MWAARKGKEGTEEGKKETVKLLIAFKADINLTNKVTRGKGWEGVARAEGLYTLCTNLYAYSTDTARRFVAHIT